MKIIILNNDKFQVDLNLKIFNLKWKIIHKICNCLDNKPNISKELTGLMVETTKSIIK